MILDSLRQKLETVSSLSVSQRGSGNAKFLYVRSPYRAIEVSEESDCFIVEYWNTSDEKSDEDSVKTEMVESESDAFARIKDWLGGAEKKPD